MLITEEKLLVHFDTNDTSVYLLKKGVLKVMNTLCTAFAECNNVELLTKKIDEFLVDLEYRAGKLNNERIRLYATGVFQQLTRQDLTKLVINIFVDHGLYFNVIQPDLEQFYLKKSIAVCGSKNIMEEVYKEQIERVKRDQQQ